MTPNISLLLKNLRDDCLTSTNRKTSWIGWLKRERLPLERISRKNDKEYFLRDSSAMTNYGMESEADEFDSGNSTVSGRTPIIHLGGSSQGRLKSPKALRSHSYASVCALNSHDTSLG